MWARDKVVRRIPRIFVLPRAVEHRPFGEDEGEWPFVEGVSFESVVIGEDALSDGEEGRPIAVDGCAVVRPDTDFGFTLSP